MKIRHRSPDRLVLEHRPVFVAFLWTFMILGAIGLGFYLGNQGAAQGNAVMIIVGGLMPLVAIISCVLTFRFIVQRSQLIFDKTEASIVMRTKTVAGFEEQSYDLADFVHADLQIQRNAKQEMMFRAVLVMSGGPAAGKLPLTRGYTNGYSPHRAVKVINKWIGYEGELS